MQTRLMQQLAWAAFDRAYAAADTKWNAIAHHEGMRARAAVLVGPTFEGPAESEEMFSMRSTARHTGRAA